MLRIVASEQAEHDVLKLDLNELVREGARRMLLAALGAEVDQYVAEHVDHRDNAGHALVVRNGVGEPRKVTTAAGELEIQAPRVRDRRGGAPVTLPSPPPGGPRGTQAGGTPPGLALRRYSANGIGTAAERVIRTEEGMAS